MSASRARHRVAGMESPRASARGRAAMAVAAAFHEEQLAQIEAELVDAKERRRRRERITVALLRYARKKKRRVVVRNDGGWESSTLNRYVTSGDEVTYRLKFRVTR